MFIPSVSTGRVAILDAANAYTDTGCTTLAGNGDAVAAIKDNVTGAIFLKQGGGSATKGTDADGNPFVRTVNAFFKATSGLSANAGNCLLAIVERPNRIPQDAFLADLGGGACQLITVDNGHLCINTSFSGKGEWVEARNKFLFSARSLSSGLSFTRDRIGFTTGLTALSASTQTVLSFGADNGGSTGKNCDLYLGLLYDATSLSAGQMTTLETEALAYTNVSRSLAGENVFLCEGDSNSTCVKASDTAHDWQQVAQDQLVTLGISNTYLTSFGVAGDHIAEVNARRTGGVAAWLAGQSAGTKILVLHVGENDLQGSGGATVYSDLQTLVAAYKSDVPGLLVVYITPPPRGDATGSYDAARSDLLTLLQADKGGIDALADTSGNAAIAGTGATGNSTNYPDGVHYGDPLCLLIGRDYVAPALLDALTRSGGRHFTIFVTGRLTVSITGDD